MIDPCTYKSLFNVECPGCGLTRAWGALTDGEVLASIQFHPALIPILFTCVFLFSFIVLRNNLFQKLTLLSLGLSLMGVLVNFISNFFTP